MRRALAILLVGGLLLVVAAPPAEAHGWGLGAAIVGLVTFAVFAPIVIVGTVIAAVVPPYAPPPPVSAPPPVIVALAPADAVRAPAGQATSQRASGSVNVVQYADGRYELRGDGVTTAYQWVWIPNPSPPPPPPPRPTQ